MAIQQLMLGAGGLKPIINGINLLWKGNAGIDQSDGTASVTTLFNNSTTL